jgi:Brp/Blh family beta-carotene 15,15'-monooxygenase
MIIVLIFFIIFFGLPHGALDTLLAKKNNLYNNFLSFIKFNIIYVLIAFITFTLWFFFPVLSLFTFLLISIFHFSEDWKNKINFLQRFALATSLISLTVFFHREEVTLIFFSLTKTNQSIYLSMLFYYINYIIIPILLLILFYNIKSYKIVMNIITIALTAFLLNPLIYFLCYFCFFHSVKNFKESKKILFPKNNSLHKKVIFLNLLITLILSVIIFKIFLTGTVEDKLLKITFIGLASLTVPHMLLKAFISYKK